MQKKCLRFYQCRTWLKNFGNGQPLGLYMVKGGDFGYNWSLAHDALRKPSPNTTYESTITPQRIDRQEVKRRLHVVHVRIKRVILTIFALWTFLCTEKRVRHTGNDTFPRPKWAMCVKKAVTGTAAAPVMVVSTKNRTNYYPLVKSYNKLIASQMTTNDTASATLQIQIVRL